jgi:flagellar biosynthesis protein FliP
MKSIEDQINRGYQTVENDFKLKELNLMNKLKELKLEKSKQDFILYMFKNIYTQNVFDSLEIKNMRIEWHSATNSIIVICQVPTYVVKSVETAFTNEHFQCFCTYQMDHVVLNKADNIKYHKANLKFKFKNYDGKK